MGNKSLSSSADQSVIRQRSSKQALHVFWVVFAIGFLNYLDRNVLTGAANIVAHELGLGIDSIGYIASAFLIVYTICIIPLGFLADRSMRKNIVALSVAVWSIATVLTAFSFNFLSLFLSRMILGVGEAGYFPAGTALLSDYFTREKRSRMMSWWGVGQLIGVFSGFVIGGVVASFSAGSWRLAFLFTGIPGLAFAFLAWRLREPRRNEADEEQQAFPFAIAREEERMSYPTEPVTSNLFSQFRDLLKIKTLVVLTVMQMFAFFVLSVAVIFLPTFLQQKDLYDLSSGTAGIFSGSVIVVAGSLGTIGGGYLADLLNQHNPGARVQVCGIGFLLSAPTFALALFVHNFTLFALFLSMTAVLTSFYTGPSAAATQDVVPSALRASAVAVTLLIAHALGDTFSPTLVGLLARLFDPTGGTHFAANRAGHDLALAMLITCTPALIIAGLVGIIGARWMHTDVEAATKADRLTCQEQYK
ncbi:MAG TPA: MFS transporter [Ktedonobacteraceae bacterium]|nr:MFS transporter [Ktedonobacteraceae bacterium]